MQRATGLLHLQRASKYQREGFVLLHASSIEGQDNPKRKRQTPYCISMLRRGCSSMQHDEDKDKVVHQHAKHRLSDFHNKAV